MNGLTTTEGLNQRGGRTHMLAAVAAAALVALSLLPAPASGQGGMGAGKVSMQDFHFAMRSSLGVGRGQTARVNVINPVFLDGSVRVVGGHVKVFSGSDGSLLRSHEINDPPAGLHSFDISRDDLLVAGEPKTGRLQLVFEVDLLVRATGRGRVETPQAGLFPATFELVDSESGQTILIGMLLPAIQAAR